LKLRSILTRQKNLTQFQENWKSWNTKKKSFNYPDLIEARFTLGLDNITLKSDKTANEILNELF